jgi:hypothetical protein
VPYFGAPVCTPSSHIVWQSDPLDRAAGSILMWTKKAHQKLFHCAICLCIDIITIEHPVRCMPQKGKKKKPSMEN